MNGALLQRRIIPRVGALQSVVFRRVQQPWQLLERMKGRVEAAELATRRKVALRCGKSDGWWFQFTSACGSDYVRVSKPNEVRLLSAKIDGVVVSANFSKPSKYNHSNAHVADALRTLADLIENAPVPLAAHDIELSTRR